MKSKKFLEYEHHKRRRGLRERTDREWVKRNAELEKKTLAGEDEAFFQLLERNPEFLKTDLAIAKIIQWRYAITYLQPFHRVKPTFLTPQSKLDEIQERVSKARDNLLKIGRILASEPRGKKRGPPLFDVYYTYRGLRSLFTGIKKIWKIKCKVRHEEPYDYILDYIEKFPARYSEKFGPVCDAIYALKKSDWGLCRETIESIILSTPSEFAREVTAEVFQINENTVRQAYRSFTRKGRGEIFSYYHYLAVFLDKKDQPLWFNFLIPMIAFEKLRGVDIE